MGVEANNKTLNDLKLQNKHADKVAEENYQAALKLADEIKDKTVEVKMKAGEGGRTLVLYPPKRFPRQRMISWVLN